MVVAITTLPKFCRLLHITWEQFLQLKKSLFIAWANFHNADQNLEKWEKLWDMRFNPCKCQVIHVTRSKSPFETNCYLHGCALESVSSAKYLGVTVSEDLIGQTTSITLPKRQIRPSASLSAISGFITET